MSMQDSTWTDPSPEAVSEARSAFLVRTYNHLFGAILAFVGLEVVLFKTGIAESFARFVFDTSWLLILGGFMLFSWMATRFAHNTKSVGMQYFGLGLMVVAEAILFIPLLYLANSYAPGVISSAAWVTLVAFAALTAIVFWTRKDFSFLRGILVWGSLLAIGAIVASLIFNFTLGVWFTVAMIVFAGSAILYDTSKILRSYPLDRHVGAAVQLFASVMLMFWYILRLFMSRR
jgi:FtsH-binding integral membrane protein